MNKSNRWGHFGLYFSCLSGCLPNGLILCSIWSSAPRQIHLHGEFLSTNRIGTQFFIRLLPVAKFKPANGGGQVKSVRWIQGIHEPTVAKTGMRSKEVLQMAERRHHGR